jgi:hypothetical protein
MCGRSGSPIRHETSEWRLDHRIVVVEFSPVRERSEISPEIVTP